MVKIRAENFAAGAELAWMVDPKSRTVEVFTALNSSEKLSGDRLLTGGTDLPGFKVKVREVFVPLDGL
jgi:hypothetical protein